MTWQVVLTDQARRDLRMLDPVVARRVIQAISRLSETGHGDLKHLRGQHGELRLRVGDYRVRLAFEMELGVIRVFRVLHRREAYQA